MSTDALATESSIFSVQTASVRQDSPPQSRVLGRRTLTPSELAGYTRLVTAEVLGGRYPHIEYDRAERWHQRIYRDARVDLWLISWMPSQGTQLHDHGGSAGAFSIVTGCLDEAVFRPTRRGPHESLSDHRRMPGRVVAFGSRYVHDVRNLSTEPAVSVHAYSPPLSQMNYYDVDDQGTLRRIATVETEDPEAEIPGGRAATGEVETGHGHER